MSLQIPSRRDSFEPFHLALPFLDRGCHRHHDLAHHLCRIGLCFFAIRSSWTSRDTSCYHLHSPRLVGDCYYSMTFSRAVLGSISRTSPLVSISPHLSDVLFLPFSSSSSPYQSFIFCLKQAHRMLQCPAEAGVGSSFWSSFQEGLQPSTPNHHTAFPWLSLLKSNQRMTAFLDFCDPRLWVLAPKNH